MEAKLSKLKEKSSVEKAVILTKDSPGIAEVISAIEYAVVQNNTSTVAIIKVISRIKRTGLKIENGTRKGKVSHYFRTL